MTQERNARDARIAKRAAEIWSAEGGLMNRHEAQWLMAMRQIDDEDRGIHVSTPEPSGTLTPDSLRHRDALEQSGPAAIDEDTSRSANAASGLRAATKVARWFFARR
ncbi:MAG TPA: DUF2934 domain-containing protein [Mesorhizobium sp.]|jgi:hypothetical protein|uniref:DUF2934 domain-containing protein n=1 Tax=Mesorhizobium sp. TaxID=1871066 RepID=UPI002DDD9E2E|nr:DUF2934 domain-containing protein [Mesorhizobium sp.]HEV2503292.1 DUF2934 domain-containing protein [Mesorhizobium sp.]